MQSRNLQSKNLHLVGPKFIGKLLFSANMNHFCNVSDNEAKCKRIALPTEPIVLDHLVTLQQVFFLFVS